MNTYPRLVVDLHKLTHNAKMVRRLCHAHDMQLTGVIKGADGLEHVIECFVEAGITSLASSRLHQLKRVREVAPDVETMMLRLPMMSQLEDLIELADVSLHSEISTLKKLEKVCMENYKQHRVVLMVDLGDLREGIMDYRELMGTVEFTERSTGLILDGIGVNLGCYGSVLPGDDNMTVLAALARDIEKRIGRKLKTVSGGATSTIPLVMNHTLPKEINHLRVGNGILLRDMEENFENLELPGNVDDAFTLEAEVIEVKQKPSVPIGELNVDAFGRKKVYEDRGIRSRALVAIGRADLGDVKYLKPLDENCHIIGSSSDHLIIDITDSKHRYRVGNIFSFLPSYENLMFSAASEYVQVVYYDKLRNEMIEVDQKQPTKW